MQAHESKEPGIRAMPAASRRNPVIACYPPRPAQSALSTPPSIPAPHATPCHPAKRVRPALSACRGRRQGRISCVNDLRCVLCGDEVSGVDPDRLRRGLDPKCYVALGRWRRANPRGEVEDFVRERLERRQADEKLNAALGEGKAEPGVQKVSRREQRQEAEFEALLVKVAEEWERADHVGRSHILWRLRQVGRRAVLPREVVVPSYPGLTSPTPTSTL